MRLVRLCGTSASGRNAGGLRNSPLHMYSLTRECYFLITIKKSFELVSALKSQRTGTRYCRQH